MLMDFDVVVEVGPMNGANHCQVMSPWNSTLLGGSGTAKCNGPGLLLGKDW